MKLPPEKIKSIAVFRALQLGDLLCSIPAFRALHVAYPAAQITLVGLPWAKSLVNRFPDYIHKFIHFPGYPGLPEQPVFPPAVVSFLQQMQHQQFDLVLQMQGNGTIVNPMVELFAGKFTAGFCIKNDYCPDESLFLEYPEHLSEIERHLTLMNFMGIPAQGTHLEFPLSKQDEEYFYQLNLPVSPGKYVCIHPGSRGSWRQWPPENFARLADLCASKNLQVVITGTKDEIPITMEVARHMACAPINTAGQTSLGAVGVLIKNSFALISNCTGVSHMASAFKTPSIVISMDGEPHRWAPLDRQLHRTIDWTKTPDFDRVYQETAGLLNAVDF